MIVVSATATSSGGTTIVCLEVSGTNGNVSGTLAFDGRRYRQTSVHQLPNGNYQICFKFQNVLDGWGTVTLRDAESFQYHEVPI